MSDDIVSLLVRSDDWDKTKENLRFILGLINDYILIVEAVEGFNK